MNHGDISNAKQKRRKEQWLTTLLRQQQTPTTLQPNRKLATASANGPLSAYHLEQQEKWG